MRPDTPQQHHANRLCTYDTNVAAALLATGLDLTDERNHLPALLKAWAAMGQHDVWEDDDRPFPSVARYILHEQGSRVHTLDVLDHGDGDVALADDWNAEAALQKHIFDCLARDGWSCTVSGCTKTDLDPERYNVDAWRAGVSVREIHYSCTLALLIVRLKTLAQPQPISPP